MQGDDLQKVLLQDMWQKRPHAGKKSYHVPRKCVLFVDCCAFLAAPFEGSILVFGSVGHRIDSGQGAGHWPLCWSAEATCRWLVIQGFRPLDAKSWAPMARAPRVQKQLLPVGKSEQPVPVPGQQIPESSHCRPRQGPATEEVGCVQADGTW